jgi:hypothetical protein
VPSRDLYVTVEVGISRCALDDPVDVGYLEAEHVGLWP